MVNPFVAGAGIKLDSTKYRNICYLFVTITVIVQS